MTLLLTFVKDIPFIRLITCTAIWSLGDVCEGGSFSGFSCFGHLRTGTKAPTLFWILFLVITGPYLFLLLQPAGLLQLLTYQKRYRFTIDIAHENTVLKGRLSTHCLVLDANRLKYFLRRHKISMSEEFCLLPHQCSVRPSLFLVMVTVLDEYFSLQFSIFNGIYFGDF